MAFLDLKDLDGEELKKIRKELEYSQTKLGDEMGYSLRAVQSYEGSQRSIPRCFKKHLELYLWYKTLVNKG